MVMIARVEEHSFLSDRLGPNATVVDLGFNRGDFSLALIDRYGARVIAAEPVGDFVRDVGQRPDLVIEEVAIAEREGTLELRVPEGRCPTVLVSPNMSMVVVPSTTLRAFLDRHSVSKVDLLKLDIEGSETGVLLHSGEDVLRRCSQITVEFHDFVDPSIRDDVKRCIDKLKSAGFEMFRFSRDNTDVLFVNRSRISLSWAETLHLLAVKYLRGAARIVRRWLPVP